jgi:hypothetical protein
MNLIERVKNMLVTPKTEWNVVAAEIPDTGKILSGYIIPLTLAGAVAAFIGYGLIGFSIMGYKTVGMSWGLYYDINKLILGIASVYITAFVVDALAPSFGSEKNFGRSFQLVAYGATPGLVAGLFAILPLLAGIVGLVGAVYSVYLWYIGLTPLKNTPEDKKVTYLVVIFLALIVVYFIIGMIISAVMLPLFGLSMLGTSGM